MFSEYCVPHVISSARKPDRITGLRIREFYFGLRQYDTKRSLSWAVSSSANMKCLELTLAIIKPNATKVPHVVKAIRNRILRSGFFVIRTSEVQLSLEEAEEFYKEHRGKFFYERLATFLASGPVHVHVLAGFNSVILWRRILGPAKVYQAKAEYPNSIRALYGVTDTRNSAHGSDSEQSAIREIHFFFPNFDVNDWHSNKECYFQSCQVKLKESEFIHEICPSARV